MDKLEKNIQDISNNYYDYLFNLHNVNGVGYGYKYINGKNTFEPCIHVFVNKKIDTKYLTQNNIVPKTYMGIKTDIIEAKKSILINKYIKSRPLKAGNAIGVLGKPGYGTMCCIVKKKIKINKSNQYSYYLLSNNHVIARYGKIPIGSALIQPIITDSITQTADIIALLDSFIPIKVLKFGIPFANTVDCAIAKLINTSLISNKVFGISEITGVTKAKLDMRIKTSGATSGIRQGKVETLHLSTTYDLGNGKEAFFKEQISLKLKSAPGDSGSPVLTLDNKLIGIATAAILNEEVTRCNDINNILKLLKVEVYLGESL